MQAVYHEDGPPLPLGEQLRRAVQPEALPPLSRLRLCDELLVRRLHYVARSAAMVRK